MYSNSQILCTKEEPMVPLSSPPAAQDRPSDQHLLQRRKAALVDGQCGGGPGCRRVPPRHVWHRGLVAHLGTDKKRKRERKAPPPSSSCTEVFIQFVLLGELTISLDAVLSVWQEGSLGASTALTWPTPAEPCCSTSTHWTGTRSSASRTSQSADAGLKSPYLFSFEYMHLTSLRINAIQPFIW